MDVERAIERRYIQMGEKTKTAEVDASKLKVVDLNRCTNIQLEGAARVLLDSFRDNWPDAWPTLDAALAEVQECLVEERIGKAALATDGSIIGWVGAMRGYNGRVWELHPLCVSSDYRKQGIGARLIQELEKAVAEQGGITIYLGTDDESNQTTLGGIDIYEDTWSRIENIKNLRDHPFSFYQRLGYKIVGVVPDANGYGKPDIMMAKRIEPITSV